MAPGGADRIVVFTLGKDSMTQPDNVRPAVLMPLIHEAINYQNRLLVGLACDRGLIN